MKKFGMLVLVLVAIVTAAYFHGVFDVEAEVTVNPKVKRDVSSFTQNKLERAQKGTDRAFEALKSQLKDE